MMVSASIASESGNYDDDEDVLAEEDDLGGRRSALCGLGEER